MSTNRIREAVHCTPGTPFSTSVITSSPVPGSRIIIIIIIHKTSNKKYFNYFKLQLTVKLTVITCYVFIPC